MSAVQAALQDTLTQLALVRVAIPEATSASVFKVNAENFNLHDAQPDFDRDVHRPSLAVTSSLQEKYEKRVELEQRAQVRLQHATPPAF